jgi:hypothetical protein
MTSEELGNVLNYAKLVLEYPDHGKQEQDLARALCELSARLDKARFYAALKSRCAHCSDCSHTNDLRFALEDENE